MAHTWLRGLYSSGHDEIEWVNKTNFANNKKGTISDSFIYAIINKVFVVLAIARYEAEWVSNKNDLETFPSKA